MKPRKYELLADSAIEPTAKKGTIAYGASKYDYSLAADDTRHTGIEHVSLSLKEDGDYPFFTYPRHMLKEIKD